MSDDERLYAGMTDKNDQVKASGTAAGDSAEGKTDKGSAGSGSPAAGTQRVYGLDLLRLVCMLMIVILHVIGQGGVMIRYSSDPAPYYMVWVLETLCFCAVNCYGLLSGYVGVHQSFRPSRIIGLWLGVFFWLAVITLALGLKHPEWLTGTVLQQTFFPVTWNTYWYFSGYAALFFLMPFFNRMVLSLSVRERRMLLLVLGLLFSVLTALPKAFDSDFLKLSGGYSFVWLAVLYIAGACIRTAQLKRFRKSLYFFVYLCAAALAWSSKILIENHTRAVYGEPLHGRLLMTYTAPTIVLCAVCLLFLFEAWKIKSITAQRVIRYLTPSAFFVYVIHTHPLIWDNILKNAFKSWSTLSPAVIWLPVLGAALAIFTVCLLADLCRRMLFSILRVDKGLKALEKRMLRIGK